MTDPNPRVATILSMTRLPNTTSGGPVWRIVLDDGTDARTKADAMFTYQISDGWVGRRIAYTLNPRGTRIDEVSEIVTPGPESIRFDVVHMDSEERELWLPNPDGAGKARLVGYIAKGRKMVDSIGPWTEWAFEPISGPMGATRRSISEAYDDARVYAAELLAGETVTS